MTSARPGAQPRLHLLEANRNAIAVMLARAVAGGLAPEGAVVILADQRDGVGRELAGAAAETAGLDADDEAERIQSRGQIPTAIIVVPLAGLAFCSARVTPRSSADWFAPPGLDR